MKTFLSFFVLFVGILKAQILDTNFNVTLGESNYIQQVIPQSDGKILICGQITSVNGVERNGIARLNEDGSLDTSFQPNLPIGTTVTRMLLKTDNNILIAGSFEKMKQLGSNGQVQTSFSFGEIPGYGYCTYYGGAKDMIQLEDGKILVVGGRVYIQDYSTNGILTIREGVFRINNDGSLDLDFTYNLHPYAMINSIKILSDGKILVGGYYLGYGTPSIIHFSKLNIDGSVNSTFDGMQPNQPVNALTLINNQIVIAGGFTSYNNQPIKHVALIQEDGSLNTTFQTGDGFNNTLIHTIKNYGIGTVLVGGQFQSFNGVSRNAFLALNPNGTLNSAVNSNNILSSGSAVYDIGIQNDGKIIVVGGLSVNSSGGKKVNTGIVRFLKPDLATQETNNAQFSFYPNPVNEHLCYKNLILNDYQIYDFQGKLVLDKLENKNNCISLKQLEKGSYLLKYNNKERKNNSFKFIKK